MAGVQAADPTKAKVHVLLDEAWTKINATFFKEMLLAFSSEAMMDFLEQPVSCRDREMEHNYGEAYLILTPKPLCGNEGRDLPSTTASPTPKSKAFHERELAFKSRSMYKRYAEEADIETPKADGTSTWLMVAGPTFYSINDLKPHTGLKPEVVVAEMLMELRKFRDQYHPQLLPDLNTKGELKHGLTYKQCIEMWALTIIFVFVILILVVALTFYLKWRDTKVKLVEAMRKMRQESKSRADAARRADQAKLKPAAKKEGDSEKKSTSEKKSDSKSQSQKKDSSASSASTAKKSGSKDKVQQPDRSDRSAPRKSHHRRRPPGHGTHLSDKASVRELSISKKCQKENFFPMTIAGVLTLQSHTHEEISKEIQAEDTRSKRTIGERIKDPITAPEFQDIMHKLGDFVFTQFASPDFYEVTTANQPGFLLSALPATAPENPNDYDNVEADVTGLLLRAEPPLELVKRTHLQITHYQHPRYHGNPSSGQAYSTVIAETMAAGVAQGDDADEMAGRKQLEMCVVNWYGRALGLPESFLFQGNVKDSPGGGTIMPNASDALHNAMLAARNWKLAQLQQAYKAAGEKKEVGVDQANRLVVYGNRTRCCFAKVTGATGMRMRQMAPGVNKDYVLGAEELEEQIQKDLAEGLIPTFVLCNYGTVVSTSCDDIKGLAAVANKYNMWLHVDASSWGVAWVEPNFRDGTEGLEEATSVCVNAPRAFMKNSSPAVYWTRDQRQHRAAFAGPLGFSWTLHRYTAFHGLKLWVEMRLYGLAGLRSQVNNLVSLTAKMEKMVLQQCPQLRKLPWDTKAKGKLAFLLQYHDPNHSVEERNQHTAVLAAHINRSRQLYVATGTFDGHTFIAIAVAHERATEDEVRTSVELLAACVKEFTEKREKLMKKPSETVVNMSSEPIAVAVAPSKLAIKDAGPPKPLVTKERIPLEVLKHCGIDMAALEKAYEDTRTAKEQPAPASPLKLREQPSNVTAMPPLQPRTTFSAPGGVATTPEVQTAPLPYAGVISTATTPTATAASPVVQASLPHATSSDNVATAKSSAASAREL
ncbi:unnamed protein product, partial [Mesorhabditis spiculigera]